MASFGCTLSSEEFGPRELVDAAVQAESAGFDFCSISPISALESRAEARSVPAIADPSGHIASALGIGSETTAMAIDVTGTVVCTVQSDDELDVTGMVHNALADEA